MSAAAIAAAAVVRRVYARGQAGAGVDVSPDPKPPRRPKRPRGNRVVDKEPGRLLRLSGELCVVCRLERGTNAEHVIAKGAPHFGDDVEENLLPLCGSGTMGCHGAKHGIPYTDRRGHRWTPEEARARMGDAILDRPGMILYVLDKLGYDAGLDHLARRFSLDEASVRAALG